MRHGLCCPPAAASSSSLHASRPIPSRPRRMMLPPLPQARSAAPACARPRHPAWRQLHAVLLPSAARPVPLRSAWRRGGSPPSGAAAHIWRRLRLMLSAYPISIFRAAAESAICALPPTLCASHLCCALHSSRIRPTDRTMSFPLPDGHAAEAPREHSAGSNRHDPGTRSPDSPAQSTPSSTAVQGSAAAAHPAGTARTLQ